MHTLRSRARSVVSQLIDLCERHAALVLLALACVTRFPGLGLPEPGLDESWSWYFVQQVFSVDHFLEDFGLGLDGPLFSGINLAIAEAFGLSVLGLRVPQAIFGATSVPLLFFVLRNFLSTRLAFLSGILAALSPYLIFHSRQARPYAQLLFFTILFTCAFYPRTPWRSETRRRMALCACTFLAVASHYYSLIYFAAFYAIVLVAHAVAGRRRELRNDFITGVLGLACAAPLLLALADGLSRFSLGYWKWKTITLPGVMAEQFLFLKSMVHPGSEWLTIAVAALLLVPLVHAVRRNRRLIGSCPVVAVVWLVAPVAMVPLGWLLGRNLLFFPRGFISCAPFLFAYWVLFTDSMKINVWSKRAYVAALMVPFLIFSMAMSHPDQPYFKHRGIMAEIVRNVKNHSQEFDVVVIHHWVLTQYFAYYYPEKVRGLGALLRREAAERGEMAAILEDLAALPDDARLLLVLNDVANYHVDPRREVVQLLRSARPMIRHYPCRDVAEPGDTLFCSHMILFGAVSPRSQRDFPGAVE